MDENVIAAEEMQNEINPVEESLRRELRDQATAHSVELELVRAGVKSVKAAVSLLDRELMKLDDRGVCLNADALVVGLKSEYPWLFGGAETRVASTGMRPTASFVRDDSKLSDAEYYGMYCKE